MILLNGSWCEVSNQTWTCEDCETLTMNSQQNMGYFLCEMRNMAPRGLFHIKIFSPWGAPGFPSTTPASAPTCAPATRWRPPENIDSALFRARDKANKRKKLRTKQTHPFSGTSLILLPFSSVSSNFSMAACPRQSWNTLKCMIIVTKIKQHNIETEEKANSQKQNHKKSHTSWTWQHPYPSKDKTQHKTFSSPTSISLLLANSTVPSFLRDLWASANVTFQIFKHIIAFFSRSDLPLQLSSWSPSSPASSPKQMVNDGVSSRFKGIGAWMMVTQKYHLRTYQMLMIGERCHSAESQNISTSYRTL